MSRKVASPKAGSKKGCLCKDGTYSTKCCDGSFQAQGIGKTESVAADGTVTTTFEDGSRIVVTNIN